MFKTVALGHGRSEGATGAGTVVSGGGAVVAGFAVRASLLALRDMD